MAKYTSLPFFTMESIHLQAAEIAIAKTDYDRAARFLNKCISLFFSKFI